MSKSLKGKPQNLIPPLHLKQSKKEKIEIPHPKNNNDEPMYDDNGYLIQPEFKNVFKEIPKYSERTFKRGYIMPVNPINGIISAKAYFLWD